MKEKKKGGRGVRADIGEDAPDLVEERAQTQQILQTGSVTAAGGKHVIHCLTVIGQIEGHVAAPVSQKATRYEHVIPQLVAVQEDPEIEGLLILLNTVGGDVEAGLALAELIAGVSKPTASLVLGGGHSIGIPLAVSAKRSFIVPTATMTIHPVRHSGMMIGVPQTMSYFERMQQRITGFVTAHSGIREERFTELMMNTGEMVMDVGSVLDGKMAVDEGLIDELGSLDSALRWLYAEIERQGTAQNAGQSAKRGARRSAGQNTAKKTQRGGAGKSGPSRKKK